VAGATATWQAAPVGEFGAIDTTRPHSARVWNYWIGGKDWYAVDEQLGKKIAAAVPGIVDSARADRSFLRRAVTLLAGHGVRQFLDIGTGLPTMDNTHEVAQRVDPACRVVYVDNDPLVLAHARALLTGTAPGVTAYIDADIADPQRILAEAAAVLDFDEPVAVMLLAVLHLVGDDEQARHVVEQLLAALPAGSYLVLTHACLDSPDTAAAVAAWNASGSPTPVRARSRAEIARYFDGLDLLDPGIVTCSRWRPEPTAWHPAPTVMAYGGVGRKP
jgi:S-adenosyl methyltransferase